MNQGFITRSFILVSIFFSINLYSCSSCSEENTSNNKINETKEDESKESIFDANAVEDSLIICYGKENDNDDGGHEYVDLDLPSGISWATCNVGANKPEEYGSFFAWGETNPKKNYCADTYQWYEMGSLSKKYAPDVEYFMNYDGDKVYESEAEARGAFVNAQASANIEARKYTHLEDEDDAAENNWGHNWRMPTYDDMIELLNECDWSWTSNYNESGVSGCIVCSKRNGKKIFFPAAGRIEDTTIKRLNECGHYLARTLYGGIKIDSTGVDFDIVSEEFGHSIRPVKFRTHKLNTYIKTDVNSYHRSAKRIISEIENVDNVNIKVSKFVSSDAKLHDIRGNAIKVVEFRIETDSVFNYDLEQSYFYLCSKYCVFNDATLNVYSFDKNGRAVYVNLYYTLPEPPVTEPIPTPFENSNIIECTSLRNEKGQLIRFDTDENYMFCGTSISFSYNKDGMLDSMYYFGEYRESSKFKYDNSQNLISSYCHVNGSGMDIKKSKRYKIVKKDRYGNWIKRHVFIDRISEGEYSEKRKVYEVEYRKIQYAD